jgi:hypothetical protein
MSFENYIVTAKCFISAKTLDKESLSRLNQRLDDVMRDRGYKFESGDPRDLLLGEVSLTMRFGTRIALGKQPLLNRVRKSYAKWYQDQYFKLLNELVDSHAHDLLFKIGFEALTDGSKGFVVEIESQPAIVAKIRQLHQKKEVDAVAYDNIVYENKRTVGEIIHALGARRLEEPSVLRPREWSPPKPIIDESLIDSLPDEVAVCLREANRCFISESSHACSVMIRKAIEVAATKKLRQEGQESRLYDLDGHEIGLGKKLDLLPDVAPRVARLMDEIRILKWLGDVSAHDPRTKIRSADLQNVAPLIRSFLANLDLKR